MSQNQNKPYDLEDRTFEFAKKIRLFVKKLPKTITNIEDGKQLIRSSGSVGANYIEANEALSKKDFVVRLKIARKEAKESAYWLKIIEVVGSSETKRTVLEREANELMLILSAILRKFE